MPDWLTRSFQEHSVLWLFFSGLAGALIKFLFDNVLAGKLSDSREAARTIRKYRYPLLRAADSLDRRLENFIRHPGPQWYCDEKDEYYRISTLYLFGTYFAWARIVERASYIDYLPGSATKDFSMHFYRTFKGLTSYYYFPEAKDDSFVDTEGAVVNRLALTAIGDLLLIDGNDATPKVMDFASFAKLVDSDDKFQRWFGELDRFLRKVRPEPQSPHWNRLLIFATTLRVFVDYLDAHSRQTSRRTLLYFDRMRNGVATRLREEVIRSGHGDLLPEYRAYGGARRQWHSLVLQASLALATWKANRARRRHRKERAAA